jgi:hypothetical protein
MRIPSSHWIEPFNQLYPGSVRIITYFPLLKFCPELTRSKYSLILPIFNLRNEPVWSEIFIHGTTDISPYRVLCLCFFSTTQLLNRLLCFTSIYDAECILAGNLSGLKASLAFLAILEVMAQWIGTVIL